MTGFHRVVCPRVSTLLERDIETLTGGDVDYRVVAGESGLSAMWKFPDPTIPGLA